MRFEEVNHWLDLQGDMGIADGEESPSLRSIIVETVTRLPDDVYSDLVRNPKGPHLLFLGCGHGQRAQAIRRHLQAPTGYRDRFTEDLIILSNELCRLPLEEACGIVAHEIAYVILGHTGIDPLTDYDRKESEVEELIVSWGFEPSKQRARLKARRAHSNSTDPAVEEMRKCRGLKPRPDRDELLSVTTVANQLTVSDVRGDDQEIERLDAPLGS